MGNTELLGKYEAMINELEDNGIYLTLVAYSIIDKHIKKEKKEYATECVKASLLQAQESAHRCSFCDSAIDQITDETNIILL